MSEATLGIMRAARKELGELARRRVLKEVCGCQLDVSGFFLQLTQQLHHLERT